MNIIFSIIFLTLNLSLILFFSNIISAKKEIYIGISLTTMLIILNFIFKAVPSQILFMAIIFSIGLIILRFMSTSMKVFENESALNTRQKSKIESFKNVLIEFIFPALVFIYQLLLIWNIELQNAIMNI